MANVLLLQGLLKYPGVIRGGGLLPPATEKVQTPDCPWQSDRGIKFLPACIGLSFTLASPQTKAAWHSQSLVSGNLGCASVPRKELDSVPLPWSSCRNLSTVPLGRSLLVILSVVPSLRWGGAYSALSSAISPLGVTGCVPLPVRVDTNLASVLP